MRQIILNLAMTLDGFIEGPNGEIKEKVLEIKRQPGKNIWLYGGAKIITTFLNFDLIDEYKLAVHPVILGKGKPLFENIEGMHKLKLVEVKGHKSGVTLMIYRADKDSPILPQS